MTLSGHMRTVRTHLGNYTPKTDPDKMALDSSISTKKIAGNGYLINLL